MAKWKKSKIITVSSLLSVLLIGIIVFLCFVPTIQAKTEQKKYYTNRLEVFRIENLELGKIDIVFLGDEHTENYKGYKSFKNYTTLNRGIKGDTTAGLIDRLKVSVFDIKPKIVVVQIGSNNLKTAADDYNELFSTIDKKLPDAEVIVQSIYPCHGKFEDRNKKIVEVNSKMKEVADKYKFHYVDIYSKLIDSKTGALNQKYSNDGINLNTNGYSVVTDRLTSMLQAL